MSAINRMTNISAIVLVIFSAMERTPLGLVLLDAYMTRARLNRNRGQKVATVSLSVALRVAGLSKKEADEIAKGYTSLLERSSEEQLSAWRTAAPGAKLTALLASGADSSCATGLTEFFQKAFDRVLDSR